MYQFSLGNGRQKQTYYNLDTLSSGNARDKSSALPCHCHTLHHMPHECGKVQPRWSAPCWCQFDYSTHTCEVLSLSFETNDSPSVPQEVSKRVDMCTVHMLISTASLWAVCWGCMFNICSKLVWNTTFFQNTSVVLLDIQPYWDSIWWSVVL